MIRPSMRIIQKATRVGSNIKIPILSLEERNSLECMLNCPSLYEQQEWAAALTKMMKAFNDAEGFIRNQQVHLTRYHRLLRKWFVAFHKGGEQ